MVAAARSQFQAEAEEKQKETGRETSSKSKALEQTAEKQQKRPPDEKIPAAQTTGRAKQRRVTKEQKFPHEKLPTIPVEEEDPSEKEDLKSKPKCTAIEESQARELEQKEQILDLLLNSLDLSEMGHLRNKLKTPEFQHLLELAYSIRKVWPENKAQYAESLLPSILLADRYYRSYGPDDFPPTSVTNEDLRYNMVVLSESHSRTNSKIIGRQILPEFEYLVPQEMRRGHLNVVHCLTYGEPWLAGIEDNSCSRGTSRFWMTLSIMAGEQETLNISNCKSSFDHLKGSFIDKKIREERVRCKVKILQALEERRIALIDASPAPIFLAGGTIERISKKTNKPYKTPAAKLPDRVINSIISISYETYIKKMLTTQLQPRHIVVLGIRTTDRIGVQNLQDLAKDMSSTFHGTLQHPSARDTQALKDHFPHMIALRNLVDSCMTKSVRHIPGKRFEIDLVRPPIVKEIKVKKGTSKKTQKGSTTKKTQPRPGRENPQKEKPNASSVQPKKSTGKTEKGSSLSKGRPQKRNRGERTIVVVNFPKQSFMAYLLSNNGKTAKIQWESTKHIDEVDMSKIEYIDLTQSSTSSRPKRTRQNPGGSIHSNWTGPGEDFQKRHRVV